MKKKILLATLVCSLMASSSLVQAADPKSGKPLSETNELATYPYVEGEFIWEIQGDFTTDSDDPGTELNDIFGYLELAASIYLNKKVQVNFVLIGEPVLDPDPGEDRFFEDHGLYLEALNTQINFSENTNLVAGKFGPGFGTAWDVTPGIYGVDFAEDYELAEFIGVGLNHTFDGKGFGEVTLGANIFFADTTFLSDSVITRRSQTDIIDGGAGNTEELDNFSITLDGADIPTLEGFSWHLGYRHLSAGLGDVDDEQGFVAGFIQETDLGDEKFAIFNLEAATFDNFGGSADDVDYLTAGLTLADGPWHLDLAGTIRDINVAGGADNDDTLFQASIGYTDQHEIDWNVGYKFAEEGDVDSHTLGIFVTKAVEFSTK